MTPLAFQLGCVLLWSHSSSEMGLGWSFVAVHVISRCFLWVGEHLGLWTTSVYYYQYKIKRNKYVSGTGS